ncbi:MAG TPA: GNAT family N-acetyltransferase [Thermoanaerobaculia bacterium]|nr:GNAT family N-acetyltransferase [Thermoanaerobaculia bacterium]
MPEPDGMTLRPLASAADFVAAVELQRATWGRAFSDLVPASLLQVSQKVGGVAAGAFDATGRLLGLVYGLSGVVAGRPAHWSHLLAVKPEARDRGVGYRLKLYQRDLLVAQGVAVVRWTYDPLEARNAHLNLNRLGAEVESYAEEMYAAEFGSELAEGIGTDRFIVAWDLESPRVEAALAGRLPREPERFAGTPIVAPPLGEDDPLPEGPRVRVEIPRSIQDLKAADLDRAVAFRAATRRALQSFLRSGSRVEGLVSEGERRFYALEREPPS